MSYTTPNNRLQITTQDGKNPADRLHEDAGDGTPICNISPRPYKGQPTQFTDRGPGEVTCGSCERVSPLARPHPRPSPGLDAPDVVDAPVADRVFGDVPGVAVGTVFSSRQEVAAAGIHRPLQAGISGSALEGADSIVISGGYEDDQDLGDELIYTGHGGQDARGAQVADQALTRQNLALALSADNGLPVRVARGAGGDPAHPPPTGYRYDGLYYVESYWKDTGHSGFDIWRFRLVRSPSPNPVTNPKPGTPPSGNDRQAFATVQRLVRNTAVTQWVKALYGFRCQVCGGRLETPAGPYAEGAHLRPVGQPHHGPDEASNVLCLCPNDHVKLDRGVIGLDGQGNVVELLDGTQIGQLAIDPDHGLDFQHAAYHRAIHGSAR